MSCLASMMENRCGCVMHMLKYDDKAACKSENNSVGKLLFCCYRDGIVIKGIQHF